MAVGAVTKRQEALTNAIVGRSKLTAGSSGNIALSQLTDNSLIYAFGNDTNVTGALNITARTAGSGFTIGSSVGGDSGFVAWMVILINDPTD